MKTTYKICVTRMKWGRIDKDTQLVIENLCGNGCRDGQLLMWGDYKEKNAMLLAVSTANMLAGEIVFTTRELPERS